MQRHLLSRHAGHWQESRAVAAGGRVQARLGGEESPNSAEQSAGLHPDSVVRGKSPLGIR